MEFASISINGLPIGNFGCSRGARQRDPLYPLLFGIDEGLLNPFIYLFLSSLVERDVFSYFFSSELRSPNSLSLCRRCASFS